MLKLSKTWHLVRFFNIYLVITSLNRSSIKCKCNKKFFNDIIFFSKPTFLNQHHRTHNNTNAIIICRWYQFFFFFLHIHQQNSVIIIKPNAIIIIKRMNMHFFFNLECKTKTHVNACNFFQVLQLNFETCKGVLIRHIATYSRACIYYIFESCLNRTLQAWIYIPWLQRKTQISCPVIVLFVWII